MSREASWRQLASCYVLSREEDLLLRLARGSSRQRVRLVVKNRTNRYFDKGSLNLNGMLGSEKHNGVWAFSMLGRIAPP